MKAVWNGATLAESDDTVVVENNHYFPADSIRAEHFLDSDTHTTCAWKGQASYRTVNGRRRGQPGRRLVLPRAQGRRLRAAEQPRSSRTASAFWKGVTVEP